MSMAREEGFFKIFYSFHIRFPALSARNILIALLILFYETVLLLSVFELPIVYFLLNILLPFAPYISFIFVVISVLITDIPVGIYRSYVIMDSYLRVRRSKTIFIAISGSYGKTTVKEYVYRLLSATFQTGKTDENMNTDIGVAISIIKNLKKDTEFFVVELGAYKRGEIQKASWYIPFQYAVITGLGNQHIDLYGDRETLITEETSILQNVQEQGAVYINSDISKDHEVFKSVKTKKTFFGFSSKDTIWARVLENKPTQTKFVIHYKSWHFVAQTSLLGKHNVNNLLPAVALALDLGVTEKTIIKSIAKMSPLEGKLSLHKGEKKATILNDSVNSNVDGFVAAIKVLGNFSHKNKVVISQGIIELGVEKKSSYERILHELYETDIRIFTTDKLFADLDSKNLVKTFNDVTALQRSLLSILNKHTIVLVEGRFPEKIINTLLI